MPLEPVVVVVTERIGPAPRILIPFGSFEHVLLVISNVARVRSTFGGSAAAATPAAPKNPHKAIAAIARLNTPTSSMGRAAARRRDPILARPPGPTSFLRRPR